MDQKRDETFKEIIVERTRDSMLASKHTGFRGTQRVSMDFERPKRHTINVFKEHSPNNTIDWSISTVKRQNDFEDRADDTDLKSLGLSHNSVRRKSNNEEGVRALEACFTQLMSQVFEMKIGYEARFGAIEADTKALIKTTAGVESAVCMLKAESACVSKEVATLAKDVCELRAMDERMTVQSGSQTQDGAMSSSLLSLHRKPEMRMSHDNTKSSKQLFSLTMPSSGFPRHDCRMCEAKPIVGKRYACLDCKSYHVCESCAMVKYHEHPLRLVINSIPATEDKEDALRNFYKRKNSEQLL